jgi:hypothetical protein
MQYDDHGFHNIFIRKNDALEIINLFKNILLEFSKFICGNILLLDFTNCYYQR